MSERRDHARRRGGLPGAGVVGAMLCVASCEEPPTMIIARIESDLTRCEELMTVDLRVQRENGGTFTAAADTMLPLDFCARSLLPPGEIRVVPRDPADSRKVILQVTGTARTRDGARYTLRQEFATTFQRGRVTYVAFSLARVCASNPCPSGYSCVPGPAGEARCASREEPVVFTQEQAAGRDAAVWGDALALDAPSSDNGFADVPTEETGIDAPSMDAAEVGDVLEETATLLDGSDGALSDVAVDAVVANDLDSSDRMEPADSALDVAASGIDAGDSGSSAEREPLSDVPPDAEVGGVDTLTADTTPDSSIVFPGRSCATDAVGCGRRTLPGGTFRMGDSEAYSFGGPDDRALPEEPRKINLSISLVRNFV